MQDAAVGPGPAGALLARVAGPLSPHWRKHPALTIGLVVVLALGAALRLSDLGLVRHSYDYAYPIYDALRILDGHLRPLLGQPSSVFLDNPPLMGYLMAIPLLAWRSPWAVYLPIVVLNTAAIWFVYCTARRLLGDGVGLLAAFLFAVNPWIVLFSRATWLPALLPLFTALMAWGLWPSLATERRSPRRMVAAFLAMATMMLTYIQAWGALAQVGPLAAASWRRIGRRPLYAGLAALCTAALLYGLGVARSWNASSAGLRKFSATGQVHLTWEGLDHAVRLVTGRDYDYVYAQGQAADYQARHAASTAVHYLLSLALLAGVVRAAMALRRPGQQRRVAAILLLWFLTPILLMSVSAHPVHPYYLLLTCPAGHVLAAWGAGLLLPSARLRWALLPALAVVAAVAGINLQRAADLVAAQPTGAQFEGWSLQAGTQVGDALRDLSQGSDLPVRIVAPGHEALLSSLSGMYVAILDGLQYPGYVVLPGQQPLLYVLPSGPSDLEALGPQVERFPERTLRFADGTEVSFVRVLPYSREAALALPEVRVDASSEAGLSLLGYTLDGAVQPGETVRCTTYWRVDELRPGRQEWFIGTSCHLVDPGGQVVANVGQYGQWGYRWQQGDVYVERMDILVPADAAAGSYRLELGLYDPIHARPFQLISANGWGPLAVPMALGEPGRSAQRGEVTES